MKVIVTRQFLNGNEIVHEGMSLVLTDQRAKQLIKNNLVAPADIGSGSRQRRAAQRAGDQRPTPPASRGSEEPLSRDRFQSQPSTETLQQETEGDQTGGQTGEEGPRSSSRRGRPRKTPLSGLVEAERGSSR